MKIGVISLGLERTYGKLFRYTLAVINPFKRAVVKTHCKVHVFINNQALEIVRNDGFIDAYALFSDYIYELNRGVVWADQDFKSSGHFYSPLKERGLYGHHSALTLAEGYYKNAVNFWKRGNLSNAMFYLGAAVHLVQDMTIPQHANIRLMDNHKQYETFVKKTYSEVEVFKAVQGGVYLHSIEEFIRYNARIAMKVHKRNKNIVNDHERYFRITRYILPLAEKTTAGCLLLFYRDLCRRQMA